MNRKILMTSAMIVIVLSLAGCGGGGGGSTPTPTNTATVSGSLVDAGSKLPMTGITVTVEGGGQSAVTNSSGVFSLSGVLAGKQNLALTNGLGVTIATESEMVTAPSTALGTITVTDEGNPPAAPTL